MLKILLEESRSELYWMSCSSNYGGYSEEEYLATVLFEKIAEKLLNNEEVILKCVAEDKLLEYGDRGYSQYLLNTRDFKVTHLRRDSVVFRGGRDMDRICLANFQIDERG